jgi:hypothetical protein
MAGPRRTVIIGDVHGCLEELDDLLRTLEHAPGRDRLVFLGDLLDRGPDPVGVVRRVRELEAECVLGNHEEKHLRWAAHEARRRAEPGYRNPMRPFDPRRAAEHARLGEDALGWMASLPRSLALDGGWTAVHAGFLPGVPIPLQPSDWVIKLRYVDAEGRPAARDRGDAGEPGVRRWPLAWRGPRKVVYGHHPQSLSAPTRDAPPAAPDARCVGIDTGCVYGGRLSAFVLPAEELVQVASRQRTHAPGGAAPAIVPEDE